MHRERDSRGRFIRGRSLIPTTPLTPPRPRSITPPYQTHIPYFTGHRILEVLRFDIHLGGSPTSSIEAILVEEVLHNILSLSLQSPTRTLEGHFFD